MERKRGAKAGFGVLLLLTAVLVSSTRAAPIPQGDTQVTTVEKLRDTGVKVSVGLQYRVMYNFSNIPFGSLLGPGGTVPKSAKSYDFFRQRIRFNVDLQPYENVGGFLQVEYRGGFGGSSPAESDPRDLTQINAFNRLQARGARYAYIYATPWSGHTIAAGILPLSDQVDDVLFSADWDFNVGGATAFGKLGPGDYRVAFVRLIEGIGSNIPEDLSRDGNLWVFDYVIPIAAFMRVGAHVYFLDVDRISALPADLTDFTQVWYGLSAQGKVGPVALRGFLLLNSGSDVKEGGVKGDNFGLAVKLEGGIPLGPGKLSILGIHATGDKEGRVDDRFVTVQEIVGTQGYWAYTHLFTANGPSDVNDLGLRIGNSGAGLVTVQGKYDFPIVKRLDGQTAVGWFRAAHARNNSSNLGVEVSGMLTLNMAKYLNLQVGAAYAFLGDFFGLDADDLFEVFSRFQLQF